MDVGPGQPTDRPRQGQQSTRPDQTTGQDAAPIYCQIMPSKPKSSPPRLSIPATATAHPEFMASRMQDDYSQDLFSGSPTMDSSNGFSSMPNWSLNDAMLMGSDVSSSEGSVEDSFDSKSLHTDYAFSSLSNQMFPGQASHSPQVYSQGYHGFPFEEQKNFPQDSFGWNMPVNDMSVAPMSFFNPLPTTPPHTEEKTSQPSYIAPEDALFDTSQQFSLGEPLYPITPLREQDRNRTIRPSKQQQQQQQRRTILSAHPEKPESTSYPSPPSTVARYTDSEPKSPRDHPYYSLPTQADGKYHCPFTAGEKPCSHMPTTQKCAYHKYLDSHLKPYHCKVPQCVDVHFSSNACLFRHEREAHGMHGHGENPHLCLFIACERSIPGNGFPRRWNLHDHMRRVHDHTTSEKASSPEGSPVISGQGKKKENAVRKRKGTRTGAQTMKRVRSTQTAKAQANTTQQLAKAEKTYYDCLTRLQEELRNMNPQEPALHDKANASLQELHTLGLNYRCIRAGQVAAERFA